MAEWLLRRQDRLAALAVRYASGRISLSQAAECADVLILKVFEAAEKGQIKGTFSSAAHNILRYIALSMANDFSAKLGNRE